jgi:hypothetical protein
MKGEEPRSPPRGEALSWLAKKFLGDLTAAASGTCITAVLSASKPVSPDVGGDRGSWNSIHFSLSAGRSPAVQSQPRKSISTCLP